MIGTKELPFPTKELEELTTVVRVIEVMGTSTVSFEDATRRAVRRAASTLRHVTGADVQHMTAKIEDGEIAEYRVDLKVAFALEKEEEK